MASVFKRLPIVHLHLFDRHNLFILLSEKHAHSTAVINSL